MVLVSQILRAKLAKKIKTMADVEVASVITAEEEPTKDIFDVVKDDGKKYTNFTLLTLVCRVHNDQLFLISPYILFFHIDLFFHNIIRLITSTNFF